LYPVVELLTACVLVLSYRKFFPTHSPLYYYLTTSPDFAPGVAGIDTAFATLANNISCPSYISIAVFFIFISALIVAARTDFQAMVIPQLCTLWLVPVGIIASYFGFTHVSAAKSITGAILGYGLLWLIAFLFKSFTKRDGMGVGDMELLAMIGSFLGPVGLWFSLMIGSFTGLFSGIIFLLISKKNRFTRIPFGPFLALGAILYFLFDQKIIFFFWG
jgi:leader peptidase (prepilin peptidase)/N-methyltransferase